MFHVLKFVLLFTLLSVPAFGETPRILGVYSALTINPTEKSGNNVAGALWLRLKNDQRMPLTTVRIVAASALDLSNIRLGDNTALQATRTKLPDDVNRWEVRLASPLGQYQSLEFALDFAGRWPIGSGILITQSNALLPLPEVVTTGLQMRGFAQTFTVTLPGNWTPDLSDGYEISARKIVDAGTEYTIRHRSQSTGVDLRLARTGAGGASASR